MVGLRDLGKAVVVVFAVLVASVLFESFASGGALEGHEAGFAFD